MFVCYEKLTALVAFGGVQLNLTLNALDLPLVFYQERGKVLPGFGLKKNINK